MRSRSVALTLFAAVSIILAACSSAATTAPTAAPTPAPTAAPTEAPTMAPTEAPTMAPTEAPTMAPTEAPTAAPTARPALKIGVVTDVGSVNDKNFNEYAYLGAVNGAAAIGSEKPPVVVPKAPSDYPKLIQSFVDQQYNVIVSIGFNLGQDTTKAAKANPNITFIGIDQSPICVDEQGNLDTTYACKGKAAELLPNYISLTFQEDQAGYLAGIVAATISKTGIIGAIGGITLCGPCIRYIQGYELGAKSINPDIKVVTAWVTKSDITKAFYDPVGGKNFGQQFIKQNKPDVLFQVAGKTGNGMLDAACDAGIYGIGVDVDQAVSYPNAAKCTVTSAEKHHAMAVEKTIKEVYAGTAKPGDNLWNAAANGVGLSPFHDFESLYTPELKATLDAAFFAMQAGTLKTCPDNCGKLP